MAKKKAAPKKPATTKVRLLVRRTGVGNVGDVVDYPTEMAEAHSCGAAPFTQPLVEIVGNDEEATPAAPAADDGDDDGDE
tara:strand:- start:518 stop:757 length:240 start_codon:yes stop_codon:yes gene_type:complete